MLLACLRLRSWIMLWIMREWVIHILYGCIRWWKLDRAKPLLDRMRDLKWNDWTVHHLWLVETELHRMADTLWDNKHPQREHLTSELRWIAQYVSALSKAWFHHLLLSPRT